MQNQYYVYILSNFKRTILYIGVTANLKRRILEHSRGEVEGFTKKYKLKYLMYYEVYQDINLAMQREKSLKGKSRKKKEHLGEHKNTWESASTLGRAQAHLGEHKHTWESTSTPGRAQEHLGEHKHTWESISVFRRTQSHLQLYESHSQYDSYSIDRL